MTRKFCDLCAAPARESYPRMSRPIGEPFSGTRCTSGSVVSSSSWQRMMEVSADFRDTVKPTGADGPPDLCASCMAGLLRDLAQKLQDEVVK
jgi:hypothetical protein